MGQIGFEVGDRVKVVRYTKSHAAHALLGQEGVITKLSGISCTLDIDPQSPAGGIYYEEIELVRQWDK